MNIQAEKLDNEPTRVDLTAAQRIAIVIGLKSIKVGRIKSDEEVIAITRVKYPQLFK
jgi:hypothetical protein